jgi:long-chain fatty acid transport protein
MSRPSLLLPLAAAVLLAHPGAVTAQGSLVDQQSACMAARAGAGAANPCSDGSAVYFNPAGLAGTPAVLSAGAAFIRSGSGFRYDPAYAPGGEDATVRRPTTTSLAPQAYVNLPLPPRLAVGFGALFPYGLGLEWPVCPVEDPRCAGPNFEGRFTGYDNALRALYLQPTLAYAALPGRLSVGLGVDHVRASMEVNRRQPGPAALGLGSTEVVDAHVEASGSGWTYHVGVLAQPAHRVSLGARYLGAASVAMDGDARFRQVSTGSPGLDALVAAGLPGDQGISTVVEFPAQLVLAAAVRVEERVVVMLDWQRTFWSSFDALPVRFASMPEDRLELDYRDASTFRAAVDAAVAGDLVVRAGFRYNEAATPRATPFLPEGRRTYWTLGAGLRPLPRLTADASFQYIHQPDRAGPVLPGGPRAGVFSNTGAVANLSLTWRFRDGPGHAPGAMRSPTERIPGRSER